jgi:hypothetical protein
MQPVPGFLYLPLVGSNFAISGFLGAWSGVSSSSFLMLSFLPIVRSIFLAAFRFISSLQLGRYFEAY